MALWLFRAGRHGEYEKRFLEENRIYLTWGNLPYDLSKIEKQRAIYELLLKMYPE
jgi:restriction system protein